MNYCCEFDIANDFTVLVKLHLPCLDFRYKVVSMANNPWKIMCKFVEY